MHSHWLCLWLFGLFATPALALPPTDKAAHFGVSAVGTEVMMKICQVADKSHRIPLWCRIGASTTMFAIGVAKEEADRRAGHKFDHGDLAADALGIVTGNILQWEF